jgi:uncharacterized protein (DUF924 family)
MSAEHPILDFWFGPISDNGEVAQETQSRWWKKDPEFDALCLTTFESDLQAIARGEREDLKESLRGCLAYILLCDQMPRNMYRDTPDAFAWDERARQATKELIQRSDYATLHTCERSFVLMPLMHSEDKDDQEISVKMFAELNSESGEQNKYAQAHKDIIDRFGRYPHRNKILGRESTEEEVEFLKQPGSSF